MNLLNHVLQCIDLQQWRRTGKWSCSLGCCWPSWTVGDISSRVWEVARRLPFMVKWSDVTKLNLMMHIVNMQSELSLFIFLFGILSDKSQWLSKTLLLRTHSWVCIAVGDSRFGLQGFFLAYILFLIFGIILDFRRPWTIQIIRASPTVWHMTCHPNLAKQAKINLQQFAKVTCQISQLAIPRCRARIFAHANPTA